ncbi:MAG: hypothetical protein CL524_00035 [Aequorivita sp.]|nr:hypothetical protein [Aequorivita sp.]
MPRATKPLEEDKTVEVTILKGCIADGKRQPVGATIKITPADASILFYSGFAVEGKAKKKATSKKAKAKPPVDAER